MSKRQKNDLVVLLGQTAVGKTQVAVEMARNLNGEIISADSRQIYRRMDIGTGKDLDEYILSDGQIENHLIDIREPGEKYDVFHFQRDFYKAYFNITSRGKVPLLCGGTGLYLESALRKTKFLTVPEDNELRKKARSMSLEELKPLLLENADQVHNTTDLLDKDRLIRAIEIASFEKKNKKEPSPIHSYIIFGIQMDRSQLRERIRHRLEKRLNEGMIKEVEDLLSEGLSYEDIEYYGLEYRFISKYLKAELSYNEMFDGLLQGIRRFAKKQMTWFRRMEKQGFQIHWMDADWTLERKLEFVLEKYEREEV